MANIKNFSNHCPLKLSASKSSIPFLYLFISMTHFFVLSIFVPITSDHTFGQVKHIQRPSYGTQAFKTLGEHLGTSVIGGHFRTWSLYLVHCILCKKVCICALWMPFYHIIQLNSRTPLDYL